MPAGRPAWKPTEEQLDKVKQLGAAQCSIEEICATLGISKQTLYKNNKLDQEFADLIKGTQDKGKAFAKSALFKLMAAGNVSAIIFYLKTQCGWKEKLELSGTVEIAPIVAPVIASKDEWNKLTQNPEHLNLGPLNQAPKPHS